MSDELFNEIRVIRSRIESIERTQEVLVRADAEKILGTIIPMFESDPILRAVYLLVDGVRGQRAIADALSAAGAAGSSEATVSRKLEALRDLDLVELADRTVAGKIYKKSIMDRLLHVTRRIERMP